MEMCVWLREKEPKKGIVIYLGEFLALCGLLLSIVVLGWIAG